MFLGTQRTFVFGAAAFALSLVVGAAQQVPVKPSQAADGLLRSEVSLGGRTATVAYAATLSANDTAHQGLFSTSGGSAGARVRVARLETNGSLRLGEIAVGKLDPAGTRYDLWLEPSTGTRSGWQLHVTDLAPPGAAEAPAVIGQIPLSRQAAKPSPNFVAALVPENGNTARLLIRWGEYEASTDVQFTDPPRRRTTTENAGANVTINRRHDEDTSVLSRARLLAQRNETALVGPKGQRLSVSFQRTFAPGERPLNDGGVRTRGLAVDGPDFARLATTPAGEIVLLTESAVPRLSTEAPLRFGKTVIPTGNQVPGFPGSYAIWLKRTGSGWRLVFNHEPDAWGSQHDPKFDAAEIEVAHSEGHAASRPFAVGIAPSSAEGGRLMIIWGPHEWSADFVVAG